MENPFNEMPFTKEGDNKVLSEMRRRRLFPKKIRNYVDFRVSSGMLMRSLENRVNGRYFLSDERDEVFDFWSMTDEEFRIFSSVFKNIFDSFTEAGKVQHTSEIFSRLIAIWKNQYKLFKNVPMLKEIEKEINSSSDADFSPSRSAISLFYQSLFKNWQSRFDVASTAFRYRGFRSALWYSLGCVAGGFSIESSLIHKKCDRNAAYFGNGMEYLRRYHVFRENNQFRFTNFIEKHNCNAFLKEGTTSDDFLVFTLPFSSMSERELFNRATYLKETCSRISGNILIIIDNNDRMGDILNFFEKKTWRQTPLESAPFLTLSRRN